MPGVRTADWLIDHAHMLTMAGGTGPLAAGQQGALSEVADGAIAIESGRIVAVGRREDVLRHVLAQETFDAMGRVVMPGFVDAHTHPVWAGSRAAEFEKRIRGATYLEISAAGGGIASTVRATRRASDDQLLELLLGRLARMMEHGTTTVEAKTGYGLAVDEELRHLALLAQADRLHPVRVVPTFLGAHAVPDEYRGRADDYATLVIEEMLPAVAKGNPTTFCDVFCDDGAFTCAQTERILRQAAELGLPLKVHSDEFAHLGCTALAAQLGATSVDHLAVTTPAEMDALAASGTVAVLLPGTTFGLGSSAYADARELISRGVPVALGTDHSPGTCPCESMPFMLGLAARYLRMAPAEALVAATRNAACATGRGGQCGRIEAGWSADLVVMDTTDHRDLAYKFGTNPVAAVMIDGAWTRQLS